MASSRRRKEKVDRWASGDSDHDDCSSITTESSGGAEVGGFLDSSNGSASASVFDYGEAIDALGEKRTATRERALSTLIKRFAVPGVTDGLLTRQETLVTALGVCLRKGGDHEAVLASRALALSAIVLGNEAVDGVYEDVMPTLASLVRNAHSATVRSSVIETLAMLVFLTNAESTRIENCLNRFRECWKNSAPAVRKAALDGWGLVATLLPESEIAGPLLKRDIEYLTRLLHDEDPAVRIASGQNIAFCVQVRAHLGLSSDDQLADDGTELNLEAVTERLQELAADSNRRQNRKERRDNRSSFRSISRAVDGDDSSATVAIKIKHQTFTFATWLERNRLDAFRSILGTGLQAHLEGNELLWEILDIEVSAEPIVRLTQLEKRLYLSPNSAVSKSRTQNMKKNRQHRMLAVGDIDDEE